MADLMTGRLLRFAVLFAVVYAAFAMIADAPFVLRVCNGIAISVAAGVCVAYAPIFFAALRAPVPLRGDYLGSGIFNVSTSILGVRGLSVVARDLGYPEIYNGPWMPLFVALGILGGLQHLLAPVVREGRIPRTKWIYTGLMVSVGILLAFAAWTAHSQIGTHPVELR